MNDTRTLSTLPPGAPVPAGRAPVLVFDACQAGVVLRAVLFVELVVAVGCMFGSANAVAWLGRMLLVTGVALPATLVWLLTACACKRLLARWVPVVQYAVAMGLGSLAGLYGCGMLALTGLSDAPPWIASACSGALLSSALVGALLLRARGRMPADATARLAELQSRIRPHFLFNTLNSAIALVRAEPAKAEALLEDLSDLFRSALKDRGAPVTLADEIILARRYLAIEQVRFHERLRVQWELDPLANAAMLPPLLLQPLVENAVRHGVEPSGTGADLLIATRRRGSVVTIEVSNTVPAGPGAQGAGVALHNVRERLALLHDVQGQFRCGMRDGRFQVRIEVPA